MSLETFIESYIECALWSSTDNADESGGAPLDDNYGPEDLSAEARATIEADCRSFYDANWKLWGDAWSDASAGHDFWLTRNGHGAGFWDRYSDDTPEGKAGRELTKAAKAFGSADLYVGDDGAVHCG